MGVFGKYSNAGDNRRQEGKRKTKYETIDSITAAMGMIIQELSGAVENRTLWVSLIHRGARSQSQPRAHNIHKVMNGKESMVDIKERCIFWVKFLTLMFSNRDLGKLLQLNKDWLCNL